MSDLIAQLRPSTTSAQDFVQGPVSVDFIVVCNSSASVAYYSIYLSRGTSAPTYSEATALYWDVAISTDTTQYVEFPSAVTMKDAKVRMAVQSSVSNAVTFSAFGGEK